MIQNAAQTTVKALLSENNGAKYHYVIPPYQREYAWTKNQWDTLFDDLTDNDKGYFLGSLICILDGNVGDSIETTVIDGQQRLTTLNLLLLALYEKIKPLNSHKKVIESRSYLRAYLAFETYFLNDSDDKLPRLTPSIQNNNQVDYTYLVRKIVHGNESNKPQNCGNRRIIKAFNHFKDRIEKYVKDRIENCAGDDVDTLFELLDKIIAACVVRIDTQDAASAFILFESINNRGVPLTPMDLIKNSMISSLKNQSAEQTNEEWQQIINNLNDYDVQVRYLRHFYQAFKPVGLIWDKDKGKEKITKNELIQTYTAVIKQQPENVLRELTVKSEIYKALSFPENVTPDSTFTRYQNKLIDLKKLSIAPAYTLLLLLFDRYPQQDFSGLLSYIEQWFMVRHLTNIPATNRTDDIFIAATKTQHEKYDEAALITQLQQALPDAEYIKQSLENKYLYEDNANLTRYLLVYLEQKQRTAENAVDFWAINHKGKPVWSVEHIYPQNPKKGEWLDDYKEWLHSLGNLTLSAYNSNLHNHSFARKSQVNDEDGKDIGLKSGNVKINDYLRDKTEWNAEHIKKRGEELVEAFLRSLK